ncbi:pRL2-19 [Streptomyces albus]|uniref:pRL2-19 n=1 Tax=Streptomyces albus TaxID=1888 RepID=UPI0024E1050C|nr:pRL2-19 [Streptomyces albus]GHJ24441.1 hypothetical protein TPA0909_60550 [Streptomyces albus]
MTLKPEEMSHVMLIAVLMHHGGSLELPREAFETDALGRDGTWHAVAMEPQPGGTAPCSAAPSITSRLAPPRA